MTQHTLKSNFEPVLLPLNGFKLFDRSGAKDAPRTLESEPASCRLPAFTLPSSRSR